MRGDKRAVVFARDFFTCQHCGRYGGRLELAHRIKQGKGTEIYIQQYLWSVYGVDKAQGWIRENIVNHTGNVVVTCPGACNDAQNIFNRPSERDRLIDKLFREVGCGEVL